MNERILLKDLIRIPERVYQGDFVLKLTEGVRDAEATVRDYVVTPQLRACFDQALGFIKDALALHDTVRHAIMARIEEQAGPAGSLVMGAVHSGHGAEALPLGLLCGVVFADDTPELREAAVRVEPYFGGARIQTSAAVALAEAASRVVQSLAESNAAVAQRCHTRAAELLRSLHVAEFVGLSPVLAAGFDARLKAAAEALSAALNSNDMAVLTAAEAAVKHALKHQEAPLQGPRAERLAMALRLLRWLRTSERKSSNFEQAAQCYVREGSFVDFARISLIGGDEIGALAGVYGRIVTTASQRRERENRAFAEHLRLWNAKGTVGDSVVPVERLLDLVVAPLAMDTPILLTILDGLSFAIHRRLLADILHLGWSELVPEEQSEAPPVVAALPTITEVSRASLLCGRLTRGSAAEERKGLAEHAALVRASRAGAPPVLFHKGDLGSGLAEDVRATIADTTRRVIAVVYNAVDAQLAGSDQLLLHWRLDDMPLLRVLLREARDAGRVVVLTGDHGHIIDQGTTQRTCEGGDRWRPLITPPGEGEIAFEGGRVLAPDGGRSAVLLWTEAMRYAGKRRGYHGGASPQEVLVPLAVLARELAPAGWAPAPPVQPVWWEELTSADASLVSPQHPAKTKGHGERQQFLFHEEVTATTADWIKELFSTPIYAAQKQLAGRGVPSDDEMRRLLDALDASGGRLSQTALAQSLRQPVLRMSGLVSAAARVLNVDQSPVLRLERSTNAVTLDRALLRAQFALRRR
jgi:PglZ domain